MATTSPDNIRTPNAGDQYALVQDLGVMADSIQSALTKRANTFQGTAAQRTAFTSTATNGMLWQDTDGIKMIWRKDGSSWAPAVWRWSGTATQMNSFAAPDGFKWYSTTDNSEYVRLGGVWRGGKGTITPGPGVTLVTPSIRKTTYGTALLIFRANKATSFANADVIGTVPPAFLPDGVWSGVASTSAQTAGNQAFSVRIDATSGALTSLGTNGVASSLWASFEYPLATP